ncbi:type IV pilus secretin PilQ family protein [Alteromonas sediminis]|uniref:Type IV pilus secretin PilQ family protein n=1 Tax=Alteromonas sediminis TaxID=2259342 RepID=A0A3N5Y043_9ALTE|nr:type IV pilus secretin PilQ family protein [Alteromonas sediminis]RPJ66370.1 type IV pilus secretin PilQ family protein [Alteromonas sediminis]
MSERFIFNKGLARHKKRHYMVAVLVMLGIGASVWAHTSEAQEDTTPPPLVDPDKGDRQAFDALVSDIQFTRSATGAGITDVALTSGNVKPQLIEAKGKMTITLPGVKLEDEQYVELDVSQFGTPVTSIETFQDRSAARIEFVYQGEVSARYSLEGTTLRVTVNRIVKEEEELQQVAQLYSGAPISLDFQDVAVRQVLQIIAQVNGFNLVTTDTVSGNITISLSGVPWDQALDMILQIKGLGKRLEGNILLIAPAEELTARETQELQSQQQVADLTPLKSASITVNYAKAQQLAEILKSQDGGILSGRGSVTVDERTNTMLIRDTQESIDEARNMVELLDIPVKQVLIESRMVTVRDNVDEQLGVRWGFTDRQNDASTSGGLNGANSANAGLLAPLSDRLNVNLPVASENSGRIAFQVASLVDGTILDLELSALEAENKGEIIASPRITVANQQEAYIEQGTEIPFVQATSSGATSVEFKKAVLSLRVTPHITPDNRIILDLVVTQDTRGETVPTSTGNAVAIDTQEIKTQVLVENGETVVLGGIFQQTSANDVNKVPLFGDLPVVGALFRNSSNVVQKRELLIFVTPKIMTESL